jgi:hypothetical protein
LAVREFFRRVCGGRLVLLIRANLQALAVRFRTAAETRAKPAKTSRSIVERMPGRKRKRRKVKETGATKGGTLLKQQIPVRTFWRRDDKKAGFCEIGTVSHDGGFVFDGYAFTLISADAAACRSGFRALKNRARRWTTEALQDIPDGFPVPPGGPDGDNGAESISRHVKTLCEADRITFTRGRRYHKNDNAYTGQKNGDVVRKTAGRSRVAGDQALAALKAAHTVLNPSTTFSAPASRVPANARPGKKTPCVRQEPEAPFRRILELPDTEVPLPFKRRIVKQKISWALSLSGKNRTRLLNVLTVSFFMFPVLSGTRNPMVGFLCETSLRAPVTGRRFWAFLEKPYPKWLTFDLKNYILLLLSEIPAQCVIRFKLKDTHSRVTLNSVQNRNLRLHFRREYEDRTKTHHGNCHPGPCRNRGADRNHFTSCAEAGKNAHYQ